MSKKRNLIFICLLILGVFLITSCLPKPPVTEGILKGQVIVPEGTLQTKDLTGQALPNATVNIVDPATGDIIATTTTDADGYYQVFVPAGGPYLLQVVKDGVVILQITPQVEVGIEYDLGTADCSTTTVTLIAQAMMDSEDLADIDLTDIETNSNFNDVMNIVCSAIEAGGDPTESAAIQQAVEDFLSTPAPAPTPTPPAVGTDATLSDLVLSEGTLNPAFASATVSFTAQVENNITSITVTPTAADTNATITVNGTPVANGSASTAISLSVGENAITIVVTAEDGTTTKTYTVTVTRLGSSAKEIIYFYFDEDDDPAFDDYIDGDINSTLHTVSLAVPSGTDVTDLTAYFGLSDGASATVGGTPQESGDTVNDFTSPLIYTVTAENGSTQEWMVTVDIKSTTSIEEYEFRKADNPALSYDVEGTINYTLHTVSLTVPYGTRNGLIATFELAAGATATVGGTPQVSGVTANDFTLPVTYTVTAQDGITTQVWTVTVDEEAVRYVATTGDDDLNDGSESSPWLTIQHALDTTPDLGTIIVKDNGPYNETINPPSTSDTDGGRVVILKSATGSTVINGEPGACTVGMYGCPEGTVMEGFTITHSPGISGKGIYIKDGSRVSMNNCTISNNDTGGGAGGLWISIGTNTVTLNDCTISNNTADGSGGGIYLGSQNSSLTLNNCTISGNQANSGKGGGIEHGTGTLTINGGTISGNSASSNGGGIYQSSGTITVKGCTISGNEAGNNYSAGICLDGGTNTIGGSGADMNTICDNYITGNSPTLDDQIGDGVSSLYGTYSGTNNISATGNHAE